MLEEPRFFYFFKKHSEHDLGREEGGGGRGEDLSKPADVQSIWRFLLSWVQYCDL